MIKTTGTISISDLMTEFRDDGSPAIGDYYRDGNLVPTTFAPNGKVPTTGPISLGDFYGSSVSHNTEVHYAGETGTFTVPKSVYKITVTIQAGGGGGASGNESGNQHGGGGGGAGGFRVVELDVTPGQNFAWVVGVRGNAMISAYSGRGGTGGETAFGSYVCTGGQGGEATTAARGGLGGASGFPTDSGRAHAARGGDGGYSAGSVYGGRGGDSPLGQGGANGPPYYTSNGNGGSASGYGAGGGGGGSSDKSKTPPPNSGGYGSGGYLSIQF